MIYVDLLSVFIASIVMVILAFFWFSPWLFGLGLQKERGIVNWKKPKELVVSCLMVFVLAYFLAFVEGYFNVVNFFDGAVAGGVVFLGLVLPLKLLFFIWSKKSFKLFLIESGFLGLSFLVMGGILAS